MDKGDRFIKAYEYLKSKGIFHTQIECAELMDASRASINRAYHGDPAILTDSFIKRFCRVFNKIDKLWLETGDGDMLVKNLGEKEVNANEINQFNNFDILNTLINQVSKLSEHLTASLQRLDERELELNKREKELYERTKKIDAALSSAIELEQKYSQLYNSQNNYIGYSHDMVSEPFNELKSK